MKNTFFLALIISSTIFAQTNTEVYVFDIVKIADKVDLQNGTNISNNSGYDSQPYFYNNDNIIFAAARNGETDIAMYDLNQKKQPLYYISETKNGGEYSPQRIPMSNNVSAVRLDKDGLQRLYSYNFKTKKSIELIANLKVAYPTWYDKKTVVAAVIVNDSLELIISDLNAKTNISVAKNVGRSVHKIPNSDLVSFISKEKKENWLLKSLNIKTKEIKTITSVGKSEDVCWLPNGNLLITDRNMIYQFNPKKDKNPSVFFSFNDKNIHTISRIAVNKTGTKIALVTEVSPRN